MPRLSTSVHAKRRVANFLKQLLAYANQELEVEPDNERIQVRWVKQAAAFELVVQAKLEDLAALITVKSASAQTKQQIREHLRHDLRLLKEFLGILVDNRTKTQGSTVWHFTLTLWDQSTAKNLAELNRHWQQCKSLQPGKGRGADNLALSEPEELPALESSSPSIEMPQLRHNLPACSHTHFTGRTAAVAQLLEYLSPAHPAVRIEITGIGGVGKTSLALEVAHRCMRSGRPGERAELVGAPDFNTIIFISAKPQQLTNQGVLPYLRKEQTLCQICRSILKTLNEAAWLEKDLADQIDQIRASFVHQQVLLIVDNLETIAEQENVLAFLRDLPATVKVIVTSCRRAVMDVSIDLEPLSEAEGIQFIQEQVQLKTDVLSDGLSPENARRLYRLTGGIPAAIVYAVGQLAQGYALPDQPAHHLLMGLALFPKPVARETIVQVVLPEADLAEGFVQLRQLSLVTLQVDRYRILPLTQKYALAELQKYPEFEREIRERWIFWYLDFCRRYGSRDWKQWHDYEELDAEWENVQAAIEWCIEQGRYESFSQFWEYVRGYTYLYGYQRERLDWMGWWIQVVQGEADSARLVQALRDQAWTFTLMGKPDYLAEAEQLLQRAWSLQELSDPSTQMELVLEQAMLSLRQERFEVAQGWLEQAKRLISSGRLDSQSKAAGSSHDAVRIAYYEAEVFCRQGQLDRATVLYEQVLQEAQQIGWQQIEIYTLNWLAEIAIDQQDLEQAESWLAQSWPIVQQQQDKRSIALHQRSWAKLMQVKGNEPGSQQWAEAAIASFTDLGMDTEAQKMQS
jgi:hypothetical protein